MLRPAVFNQLSEKGRARYYQLKPILEKRYQPDEVVLIETDSGDYFVAKTTAQAYQKAKRKYPAKRFFIAQVGQLASLLKSLRTLDNENFYPRIYKFFNANFHLLLARA